MDQDEPRITYSQFIKQCTALDNYGCDQGLLGQRDVICIFDVREVIERPSRVVTLGEWKVWMRNILMEKRQHILIQFDYMLQACKL